MIQGISVMIIGSTIVLRNIVNNSLILIILVIGICGNLISAIFVLVK